MSVKKNKLFLKTLILFLILIVGFLMLSVFGDYSKEKKGIAVLNGNKIKLIIARTPTEREKGLAIYNSLPKDKGMLFIFEKKGYYPFWMKDMKFPIDIIFINDNKIVSFSENLPVPTKGEKLPIYESEKPFDSALEINAGLIKKFDLKVGDEITYENSSN